MTYCAGILVDKGLVMIADTRTNAGLDDVSTYRKLHMFVEPGERVWRWPPPAISRSPSRRQPAHRRVREPGYRRDRHAGADADDVRAAQLIGHAIRRVRSTEAQALEDARIRFEVSMLFGGQIRGGPMRLFMVYSAGNFIECSQEAPFLQIGEHKYGKPILDRAVKYSTQIYDALKIGLISIDSTMRSNLAVGLPIDIAVICRDSLDAELVHRIEAGEPYFHDLRERWSAALRAAHMAIPRPPYGQHR
jgi:putative proteasome-type protease